MKYIGGKYYQAKHIAPVLSAFVEGRDFYEPFVGAFNIVPSMKKQRKQPLSYLCSDRFKGMITLWRHVQYGWLPPLSAQPTKETWLDMKASNDQLNPLWAVYAFGCSFGGTFFGSFIGDKCHVPGKYTHYVSAINSIKRKQKYINDVILFEADFFDIEPSPGSVIYCDPPYKGTGKAGELASFDHDAFWKRSSDLAKEGHLVFVSERQAPEDWICIKELKYHPVSFSSKTSNHLKEESKASVANKKYVDQLFVHESQLTMINQKLNDNSKQIELF